MNRLMEAAATLYLKRHDKEVRYWMDSWRANRMLPFDKPKYDSLKIWTWATNRWGEDFAVLEYERREGK